MYTSTRIYLTILSLLFPLGSWADATCYFPDGTIAEKYQACNPGQLEGSACCDITKPSVCLTGGYCLGDDRFIYRRGCTHSNWTTSRCASECKDVQPHTYSPIFPCDCGTDTSEFCCSDSSKNSCCNTKFHFDPGSPYTLLSVVRYHQSTSELSGSSSTSELPSTSTSPSTQTIWSTTTSTNPALCGISTPSRLSSSRNFIAIELGVVVPLSLLVLLSLSYLFFQKRQLRTMMESLKREKQAAMSQMQRRQSHGQYPLVPTSGDVFELEHTHRAPAELHSQSLQVYGAATRFQFETGSLETRSYHP